MDIGSKSEGKGKHVKQVFQEFQLYCNESDLENC